MAAELSVARRSVRHGELCLHPAGRRQEQPLSTIKNYKKPFAPLANRAVWLHSAERFLHRDDVKQLIVVISPEDREYFDFKFSSNVAILGIDVVEGGAERADSVERALARVKPDCDYVCDPRRRPPLPGRCLDRPRLRGSRDDPAPPSSPCRSRARSNASSDGKTIQETVSARGSVGSPDAASVPPRRCCWRPTPSAAAFRPPTTPSSSSGSAQPVTVVKGSPVNLKITTQEDLRLAEHALKALPKPKFTGPAHPFAGDDMWR